MPISPFMPLFDNKPCSQVIAVKDAHERKNQAKKAAGRWTDDDEMRDKAYKPEFTWLPTDEDFLDFLPLEVRAHYTTGWVHVGPKLTIAKELEEEIEAVTGEAASLIDGIALAYRGRRRRQQKLYACYVARQHKRPSFLARDFFFGVRTRAHARTHTHTHTRTHARARTHAHARTHRQVQMHARTCTFMHLW